MVTDPISNLIISIKNDAAAKKETVRVPYSKMKHAIATVLEKEGYIKESARKGKKTGSKYLEVSVVFDAQGNSRVHDLARISKP